MFNDRHNFITWEIRQPSKVLVAYTQLGRQILSPHTAISFHVADPHFPGRKVSTLNILASTDLIFFQAWRTCVSKVTLFLSKPEKKTKKTDSMRQLCSFLHCISRETLRKVPRFIARAKSNWTSCIITSSSATSTLPGRPVLTSTRLHTNRKYQNCQSQRKKCLPTSWSLSLTPKVTLGGPWSPWSICEQNTLHQEAALRSQSVWSPFSCWTSSVGMLSM